MKLLSKFRLQLIGLHRQVVVVAVSWLVVAVVGSVVIAAEPSIKVQGVGASPDLGSFINQLSTRILSDAAREAAGSGSGVTQFFDFNQSLTSHANFADLPSAEKALIRGAKRTYNLFRALGGQKLGQKGVAEVRDGRYYLTLDGEGGRWVATAGEALRVLGEQLARLQLYIYPEQDSSISCPFNFNCLLKSDYIGDVPTIAFVPRGTTLNLQVTGEKFTQSSGPPVMIVSDGVNVLKVEYIDSENLAARISINSDAPLGVNIIDIFNEGTQFRNVGRYGLNIVASLDELEALFNEGNGGSVASSEAADPTDTTVNTSGDNEIPGIAGTGTVELLQDDHGATTENASVELNGQASGNLEVVGDVDLLKVIITQAGKLTVRSEGPTDVSGALEDANGNVLASDDDGGVQYNFVVQAPVARGDYFIRVSHCCGGKGAYRLIQQFQAN